MCVCGGESRVKESSVVTVVARYSVGLASLGSIFGSRCQFLDFHWPSCSTQEAESREISTFSCKNLFLNGYKMNMYNQVGFFKKKLGEVSITIFK